MPIGGGKGGSDFDPRGRSEAEVMRFCQSFMTELYRHLGEYTDVPAGDIGVGGARSASCSADLADHRTSSSPASSSFQASAQGHAVRTRATGYDLVFFVGGDARGRRHIENSARGHPSGSGNVAIYVEDPPARRAMWPAPTPRATSVDEASIDLELLKDVKESAASAWPCRAPPPRHIVGGSIWDVLRHRAALRDAEQLGHRGIARCCAADARSSPGANMPTTPDAVMPCSRRTACASRPARP